MVKNSLKGFLRSIEKLFLSKSFVNFSRDHLKQLNVLLLFGSIIAILIGNAGDSIMKKYRRSKQSKADHS